ncbi:MAG: hypothetical protein GYA14_07640 [Ignavibacteria bacterium]|nr:hypothetical protein [Ignavibacteria bacterium]
MKKLLLFLTIPFISLAQENQLKDFNRLLSSIKSGAEVRTIIHYSLAKLVIDGKTEQAPDAIGGMNLNTFEYFAIGSVRNDKAFVSASETVLISHPRYGYVLNYIKLRIYEDNTVEIIARYLDPKTYEIKMDEIFYGEINNGSNNGAVYLFLK